MKLYQNLNVTGSLTLTGSLNTVGTITATTLVVQTITSSVTAMTGSNIFGSLASNTQVFTGSMYVTGGFYVTSGNVGIGTNSPSTALHVSGTLTVNGNDGSIYQKAATANSAVYWDIRTSANARRAYVGYGGTSVTDFTINNNENGAMIFSTNNAEKMRISSLGHLLIGTTNDLTFYSGWDGGVTRIGRGGLIFSYTSDDANLMISQNYYINAAGTDVRVNAGAVSNIFMSNGGVYMRTATSNSAETAITWNNPITLSSTGFVGIQQTTPTCPLHVLNLQSSGAYPSLGTIGTGTTAYLCNNNTNYGMLFGMLPTGNGWIQVARTDNQATAYNLILQPLGGSVTVTGALSKGSGSFRIKHPLVSKKSTHQLVHSFIEGPQADLIYRGKVKLVAGRATVNIDEVATMTEGTFEALCREIQCFTSNETSWDNVRGKVEGNILTIESQNTESTDEISWMVIGERQDEHMFETDWTDSNGKVIVEPLNPE